MQKNTSRTTRKESALTLIASLFMVALLFVGVTASTDALAGTGYRKGDAAAGKLVPYYEATSNTTTIISMENTAVPAFQWDPTATIFVHAVFFDVKGAEQMDIPLCLPPWSMGHIVLQEKAPSPEQMADMSTNTQSATLTVDGDKIQPEGYVTLAVTARADDCTGTNESTEQLDSALVSWAVVQDIATGLRPMEVPVQTAGIDSVTGQVSCVALNCSGLIPEDSHVLARFDVNPDKNSETKIFVWLNSNGTAMSRTEYSRNVQAWMNGEFSLGVSTTMPLPNYVNIVDPEKLAGMGQLVQSAQYRGIVTFEMPDLGFLWSHISQDTLDYLENFVTTSENYLGVNMSENAFLDWQVPATANIPPLDLPLDLDLPELPLPQPFR